MITSDGISDQPEDSSRTTMSPATSERTFRPYISDTPSGKVPGPQEVETPGAGSPYATVPRARAAGSISRGLRFGFLAAFLGMEDGVDGKECLHSAEYTALEPLRPLNRRIMPPERRMTMRLANDSGSGSMRVRVRVGGYRRKATRRARSKTEFNRSQESLLPLQIDSLHVLYM